MTEEKKEKNISVDLVIKYIEEGKNILSVVSEPITEFDDNLKELIDRLSSSLYFYEALGISAIQLGIPKRVFLIRADKDHFVPFVNPEILETSEETDTQKEGCLSFPGIFIPVTRPKKIKVKYQEASGEEKIIDLEGIHARCFLHECLFGNQKVVTEKGLVTIKEIVDKKLKIKVLSFNEKLNILEYKNVIGYRALPNTEKDWISVQFGKNQKSVRCTPEHLFACIDDPLFPSVRYEEAKNLEGKFVLTNTKHKLKNNIGNLFGIDKLGVLIGCFLGDGHIDRKGQFHFVQGEKQLDYLNYKFNLLEGIKITEGRSGYSSNKTYKFSIQINEQTKKLRELGYMGSNKVWFDQLYSLFSEMSLAIWYMDDGTLTNKGEHVICTDSFSQEDVLKLIEMLKNKFNLNSFIYPVNKLNKTYFRIRIPRRESSKFCNLISKFVPDSMLYKLPEEWQTRSLQFIEESKLTYSLRKVKDVFKLKVPRYDSRLYDISVEDNNNFFVDEYLVHNCDHLNGVTFLDHVSNLVKESVYKKMQKAKKNGKLERDTLTLMYLEALAEDRAKEKEKNNE